MDTAREIAHVIGNVAHHCDRDCSSTRFPSRSAMRRGAPESKQVGAVQISRAGSEGKRCWTRCRGSPPARSPQRAAPRNARRAEAGGPAQELHLQFSDKSLPFSLRLSSEGPGGEGLGGGCAAEVVRPGAGRLKVNIIYLYGTQLLKPEARSQNSPPALLASPGSSFLASGFWL